MTLPAPASNADPDRIEMLEDVYYAADRYLHSRSEQHLQELNLAVAMLREFDLEEAVRDVTDGFHRPDATPE